MNRSIVLLITFFLNAASASQEEVLLFSGTESCKEKDNETRMEMCEEFKRQSAIFEKWLTSQQNPVHVRHVNELTYKFVSYASKLGREDIGYVFVRGARVTTVTGRFNAEELEKKWVEFDRSHHVP